MSNTATLITALRALEQLTQTEAQIARFRVAQARTEAVRRELRRNADNAERRGKRLVAALDELDAVPNVVAPAVGRVLALVKSTLEQGQPLDEALLGDLTLEHQLHDRARYLKVLAEKADRSTLARLAGDLVTAHSATIDWLTTVLAEEALGGPSALVATPLQRLAGGVTRAVSLPTRFAVERVNRAVHTVARTSADARATAGDVAGRVLRIGGSTGEVMAAGRDAALQRAERVATREGAGDTAGTIRDTRRDLGALQASELPVQGYEEMPVQAAIAAIRELSKPDDLTAMIAFEEAHKNRAGVVSAAQTRFAAVAKDAAGVR